MRQMSKPGAFTLLAIACLTIMVGCVIVPGLSEVASALGVPYAASWLVTVPALGVVIFGPLAGRLIDRAGTRNALIYGLFFYGFLGAGGVFLHGLIPVMLDRLLLGGATAVVMSAGTGLISHFYTGHARLKMIAAQGMSIELGGVIFLFIGGLLAALGWRWPFVLYLISWLFLLMLIVFVPPTKNSDASVGNKATINKYDAASRPGKLKDVYLAALCSMICFFTAVIVIPQKFHSINIGVAETGYFLSFISLIAVFAAALMPRVIKKLNEQGTLYLAFACYAVAHLIFSLAQNIPLFVLGGVFMGAGFGFSVPLVNHMTVEKSHDSYRGRNLAYLSMAIFLGQFLSSFMEFIPGNISLIFIGAALLAILVIVVLLMLKQGGGKKEQHLVRHK